MAKQKDIWGYVILTVLFAAGTVASAWFNDNYTVGSDFSLQKNSDNSQDTGTNTNQ